MLNQIQVFAMPATRKSVGDINQSRHFDPWKPSKKRAFEDLRVFQSSVSFTLDPYHWILDSETARLHGVTSENLRDFSPQIDRVVKNWNQRIGETLETNVSRALRLKTTRHFENQL